MAQPANVAADDFSATQPEPQAPPSASPVLPARSTPKPILRRAGTLQPHKRASITVLLRQRPYEAAIGCATSHGDDTMLSCSEALSTLPFQATPSMGRTGTQESTPTRRDEQIKVERFERMMDRFQLRHMPVTRSGSSASTAALTSRDGARSEAGLNTTSRRTSIDMAAAPSSAATASETVRRGSRRPSDSGHATAAEAMELAPPSGQWPSGQRTATPSCWRTLPSTGGCTRWRLAIVSVAFTVQLVYMPSGIVYYAPHHGVTIVVDSVVAVVFLLNLLATRITEVHTPRGPLVTSHRAIARHYHRHGLVLDVAAAVPFAMAVAFIPHLPPSVGVVVRCTQLLVQAASLHRHISVFRAAWKKEAIRADQSVLAWMLYSRYSHLVRIGGLVLLITLKAHYLACMWTALVAQSDPTYLTTRDPITIHVHSIYDTLQLLQGQGVATKTTAQDIFGSFAVLLGSIALAVVFGHVAILVSNFSANQTSYQRKMERVFAIMGKLQLPHPIRERVHQYYEYLYAEYESLDGEIVTFAKELSHTLELEVVLFKYMDVVMHVPHWRTCSPDFQKQLVLNLSVRVYLPDDFIMRRGEVGTECYIINRGTCKQHEYETGNYEPPTLGMIVEEDETPPTAGRPDRPSSQSTLQASGTARKSGKATIVRPQSRFSVRESGRSEPSVDSGTHTSATELTRGQSIGAMSLLANYARSSDLRAVTYVEMCVIERETFQRLLTRYPQDRAVVLGSIVTHMMTHLAATRVPCLLLQMVHDVVPGASVADAIALMTQAMNPPENDTTIVFGVTEQLAERLRDLNDSRDFAPAQPPSQPVASRRGTAPPASPCRFEPRRSTSGREENDQLLRVVQEINVRLARIEEQVQRPDGRDPLRRTTPSIVSSGPASPRASHVRRPRRTLSRRHTTSQGSRCV